MTDARVHGRPYWFEIAVLANLALIAWLASRHGMRVIRSIPGNLAFLGVPLLMQLVAGVAVRGIIAAARGQWRIYWRRVTNRGWLTDSVRLIVTGIMLIEAYGWIKLTIPVLHPRLFDRELWELDRVLFFGMSPNIFFLNLFSPHAMLRVFDWTYANIFLASMFLSFGFFLSSPSRRLRMAFLGSLAILWLGGAWLYVLVPSLGPAYYFPDVWFTYGSGLANTQRLQSILMQNYQNFLRVRAGESNVSLHLAYGIAAFPSLHVGFQTLAFCWFRKLWLSGQVIFAIFVFMIFLGSVVTGWHYLVDAYAGLLLGVLSYWPMARHHRVVEFVRLRVAVTR